MLGEIVLARPVPLIYLTLAAAVMGLSIVLLFAFGTYTRRTTVDGVLMPRSGIVKVYAQQPGIVLRKAISDGDRIKRGAVLYAISSEQLSAADGETQAALIEQAHLRKRSLEQEASNLRVLHEHEQALLQAKAANLGAEMARLEGQIATQRDRVGIAADSVARYAQLIAQDASSADEYQQRQTDLLEQRLMLQKLQGERENVSRARDETAKVLVDLPLKQQNHLAQIERSLIDVTRSLIESEARRELIVTAPEDGLVTAITLNPGQFISTTQPVASIVPEGAEWQAQLFVPSHAAGFVRVGDRVNIRYQAFPYQKFGQYRARVASIARVALSAEELQIGPVPTTTSNASAGTFYRVIAALESQSVTAYGKQQSLQAGMNLQADILQERRRLFEWVLEPLLSLTGKL